MGRAKTIQQIMDSAYARKRWPDRNDRHENALALADAGFDSEATRQGILIDISGVDFAEPEAKDRWFHVIPVGQYDHPVYDPDVTNFTPERIQNFARSVTERYTGIDPDIDFEHKGGSEGGKAAGWVTTAEARLDGDSEKEHGMYVQIEWTPKGLESLKNKEYKYFSPELASEWSDPKTGTKYKDVFFGGALTNRPFLKDLTPLNFDEAFATLDDSNVPEPKKKEKAEGGDVKLEDILKALGMTLSEVRTALSLDESAAEADIIKAFKASVLGGTPPEPTPKADVPEKFAQEYPDIAKRMADLEADNVKTYAKLHETETDHKLDSWFGGNFKYTEGEGDKAVVKTVKRALAPVTRDKVKEFRLGLSGDSVKQFDALLDGILRAGTVETAAVSRFDDPAESEISGAGSQFLKLVNETRAEYAKANDGKKLSFSDGVRAASEKDPELARQWRDEQRTGSPAASGE